MTFKTEQTHPAPDPNQGSINQTTGASVCLTDTKVNKLVSICNTSPLPPPTTTTASVSQKTLICTRLSPSRALPKSWDFSVVKAFLGLELGGNRVEIKKALSKNHRQPEMFNCLLSNNKNRINQVIKL